MPAEGSISSYDLLRMLSDYVQRPGSRNKVPFDTMHELFGIDKRTCHRHLGSLKNEGLVKWEAGSDKELIVMITKEGKEFITGGSGGTTVTGTMFNGCNFNGSNVAGRDNIGSQTVNTFDISRLEETLEGIEHQLSELRLTMEEDAAVRGELTSLIEDIKSKKVDERSVKSRLFKFVGAVLGTSADIAQVASLAVQLLPFMNLIHF